MTRDDSHGRRNDVPADDRTNDPTTSCWPSRRRLLRATAGLAVTGSLAGCSGAPGAGTSDGTDATGDGTADGTSDTPGRSALRLPPSAVEALSLAEVAEEEVSVGEATATVVAYRRDREPSTAAAGFATAIDDSVPPVGRNVLATEFDVEEVPFPAEGSPSVPPEYAGVFAPASARVDGEGAPDELLTVLAGSEMPEEVTVGNENTRVFEGPAFMPSTDWFSGATWVPGSMWVTGRDWVPGSMWIPMKSEAIPKDPETARVVVSGGDQSLEDLGIVDGILGEKLDVGETVSSENTLFAYPGSEWFPGSEWSPRRVFDAGVSAEMGGAGAGVALLSTTGGGGALTAMAPGDLLTSVAGKRALAMAGATDADEVEWLAGPTRLDDTDHFNPENHAYGGEFFVDVAPEEVVAHGGVVAGASGPRAVITHVCAPGTRLSVVVDATPVGSATPFEEGALDHVFPSSRLHRSRGFLWTAGGGEIQAGEAATATPTPDCGQTTIDEDVTTDTTLREGCTYTLAGEIDVVEGATLTVEPGVTVEAEEASRLLVYDGALVAKGTEEDPIEFRGTSATREHWKGIVVESDAEANALEHVAVSDAGRYNSFYKANLAIGSRNPARMTVRNCEFTNSAAAGVRVEKEGTLTGFGNNRFADNQGPPLDVIATQLGVLEGTSTFEDDGNVVVRWRPEMAIETDATWSAMEVPYRVGVGSYDFLPLEATVEVEPGARLEFVSGRGLYVGAGALVAVGKSENPIEFVGTKDELGAWMGIVVESEDDANELDEVLLSDAGAYSGYVEGNLVVGPRNPGRMTVRNSTISDSASWGIRLVNGQLDSGNNVYKNNAEGGLKLPEGE
jgi:hypothetical protein